MPLYRIIMRPSTGSTQTFPREDGAGQQVERPLFRDITVAAEDEEGARLLADQQAIDIAVQYETPRYVVDTVEEISE